MLCFRWSGHHPLEGSSREASVRTEVAGVRNIFMIIKKTASMSKTLCWLFLRFQFPDRLPAYPEEERSPKQLRNNKQKTKGRRTGGRRKSVKKAVKSSINSRKQQAPAQLPTSPAFDLVTRQELALTSPQLEQRFQSSPRLQPQRVQEDPRRPKVDNIDFPQIENGPDNNFGFPPSFGQV